MRLHVRQVNISLILTIVMTVLITLFIQEHGLLSVIFIVPVGYFPVFWFLAIALDAQNPTKD